MDTAITADTEVWRVALPSRFINACMKHNIEYVYQLVRYSEEELLRWRNVGPGSVRTVVSVLAENGLALATEAGRSASPPEYAEAAWIGEQLEALATDKRTQGSLGNDSTVMRRRKAWKHYRWATGGIEDNQPDTFARGGTYEAYALPGSLELHLEGLNRLAREELGPE